MDDGVEWGIGADEKERVCELCFLIPAELPLPALAALSFLVLVLQSYKWFP